MSTTRRGGLIGDAAAFVIPLLTIFEVSAVGRLFVSELVLLFVVVILLPVRGRQRLLAYPWRTIFLLGVLWLGSQVVTDIICKTQFYDWTRGWAKIIFFLSNIAGIALLFSNRKKRYVLFGVGLALSSVAKHYISPSDFGVIYPWKFGVGPGITMLLVLFTTYHRVSKTPILIGLIMTVAALLNFYLGFRSLGGFCALTGIYLLICRWKRNRPHKKFDIKAVVILGAGAIFGAFIIMQFYGYGAREGWFGEQARYKYQREDSGALGVLLGGRSELFASTQAIIDSPLIGHGSWAKDSKYVDLRLQRLAEYGYDIQFEVKSDLIPAHSYLFGAWVDAGLLGAIFWGGILYLLGRSAFRLPSLRSSIRPLATFAIFNLAWAILFSPFGATARIYAAYYISLAIFGLHLATQVGNRAASKADGL